jgi:citrate lyase subunit beta/citryl-CoA lyase
VVVERAVTALFVPGSRPDRYQKAVESADLAVIDLEDAVAAADKAEARARVVDALGATSTGLRAVVRINAVATPYFDDDLAALAPFATAPTLAGIMLPKAECSGDVDRLAAFVAAGTPIVALIESALGVQAADEIARTSGVTRLAFGGMDYAADVGVGEDDRFLDYPRSRIVVASRAAGIAAPLDSPSTAIDDVEAVSASAATGRGFGFTGKLCIHPNQLEPVRRAFLPSAAEVEWARTVIGAGDGASRVDGHMVDAPVIAKARRVLALVESHEVPATTASTGDAASAARTEGAR